MGNSQQIHLDLTKEKKTRYFPPRVGNNDDLTSLKNCGLGLQRFVFFSWAVEIREILKTTDFRLVSSKFKKQQGTQKTQSTAHLQHHLLEDKPSLKKEKKKPELKR